MPVASAGASSPQSKPSAPPQTAQLALEGNDKQPLTLQAQLLLAQGEVQTLRDTRLQKEISDLEVRYSGNTELATRVANARAERDFAASDTSFASTIAPLQAKVTDIEEQIRKTSLRTSAGTLGGGGSETLG